MINSVPSSLSKARYAMIMTENAPKSLEFDSRCFNRFEALRIHCGSLISCKGFFLVDLQKVLMRTEARAKRDASHGRNGPLQPFQAFEEGHSKPSTGIGTCFMGFLGEASWILCRLSLTGSPEPSM